MTKWVEWVDPLGSGSYGTIYCRARAGEIISYMKEEYQEQFQEHPNYPYKSDQEALDDFVATHWGSIVEDAS